MGGLAASGLTSALPVVGVELGALATVAVAIYLLAWWVIGRLAALQRQASGEWSGAIRARVRNRILAAWAIAAAGILAYNGWLIARGVDVPGHTVGLIGAIGRDTWIGWATALLRITAGAIGVVVGARLVRAALRVVEDAVNRWDQVQDNDGSLALLFTGLNRAVVTTGWLLLAIYGLRLFGLPEVLRDGLVMVVRAYLVIAVGLLVIRSSVVVVDTFDGFSRRYAERRGWLVYYDHLRPLVPTFRACLEYALWVAVASLTLLQLGPVSVLAVWGPRLMQAIGLFFLARVAIELGHYEIGRRLLPAEGLDEMTRRRRATTAPLLRSTFTYAVYFTAAVLILASLGFNPMPFLAGAGILGLVVGFGAQSLINDVVSGFFILFENTYLVGDVIEAGAAKGMVEAIEFRTTKIRDADGRVHIIRNGGVKDVINYSKDYTMAVVPVDVAYDADMRWVFGILREAGERVRAENPDVLADTTIDGITAFGPMTMTVRTSTRVKPGRHEAAAAALRFAIKDVCDRRVTGGSRRGLVPVEPSGQGPPPPVQESRDSGAEKKPLGMFAGPRGGENRNG